MGFQRVWMALWSFEVGDKIEELKSEEKIVSLSELSWFGEGYQRLICTRVLPRRYGDEDFAN